ncbi:MAG: aminoacyl-tRNA hydrolase [Gammaproteobacteria bacterium]
MDATIKLLIGLANPGAEYARTRHNAGGWFVERVAEDHHATLRNESKLKASFCKIPNIPPLMLAVPSVYMNQSGETVKALLNFYKLSPKEILIAHDDIDLGVGQIKIKETGGHGGHNGLRDIFKHIGTQDFWRLRIGVGHPGNKNLVTNYVLKPPSISDRKAIDEVIDQAAMVLPDILSGDMQKAMQQLHTSGE